MFKRIALLTAFVFSVFPFSTASAACSWSTLSNGSVADATRVMNNFDCVGPLGSVRLSLLGSGVGTGYPANSGSTAVGNFRINDASNIALDFGSINASPFPAWIQAHDSSNQAFNYPLALQPNGGNVGIGLVPGGGIKLSVLGSVAGTGAPASSGTAGIGNFRVDDGRHIALDFGTINSSPFPVWMQVHDSSHQNSNYPLALQPNGGNVAIGKTNPMQALDVAGTIRQANCTTAGTLSANTSGDIICTSDARLKNILGAYKAGLSEVARITPQRFRYKTTKTDPIETFIHAGFIAQDVMAVLPEASAKQRSGYYSLDTTAILAASLNAIKQLKALNDLQAHEIRQLESRVLILEEAKATKTAAEKWSGDVERSQILYGRALNKCGIRRSKGNPMNRFANQRVIKTVRGELDAIF